MDIYFHSYNKNNSEMFKYVPLKAPRFEFKLKCLKLRHARGQFVQQKGN